MLTKVRNLSYLSAITAFTAAYSSTAFASDAIPSFIDYFSIVLNTLGIDKIWMPTISGLAALLLVTLIGFRYSASVKRDGDDVKPKGIFSMRFILEGIMDFIYSLGKENCGDKFRSHLPLLSALFLFILTCNAMGMVPGFAPATVWIDTNLAMGLIVFVWYNGAGFKEHGISYLKQLLGPVAAIAPLFLGIEIISHAARPISLALRLLGNIFADHLLLGVFTGLTYTVVPIALMFFGLLVVVVQSFIFTLLTAIYISLAISHDH